jgi:cell division transport system permease protein
MKRWLNAHQRAAARASRHLLAAPLSTAFNTIVIGIALALPLLFYLTIQHADQLARRHAPRPEISLFLKPGATDKDASMIAARLKNHTAVESARFVGKDQALKALEARAGLGDIVAGLGHNPLPDAFVVSPKPSQTAELTALRDEWARWPGIADAHVDSDWAKRLDHFVRLAYQAVWLLGGALAVALATITFNTIRLQMLAHRDEIEVSCLIGATDGYIQRPYLYFGAYLGILGGTAALAICEAARWMLNRYLEPVAGLYGLPLTLPPLPWQDMLLAVSLGAALGWAGAGWSVRTHKDLY